MAQFKLDLSVMLNGESKEDVTRRLEQIMSSQQWELTAIEVMEDKPVLPSVTSTSIPVVPVSPRADNEQYVTYRVADEKFRVFAKELGLQGTELKVPKNRDFLQLRIRSFLEQLGYQVEPKVGIRVVAESHMEAIPEHDEVEDKLQAGLDTIFLKRI